MPPMHSPPGNSLSPDRDPAPGGAALLENSPQGSLHVCLRKALGHELPNHLTAIQGLIRVLEWEEADRLSEGGLHYLRRLAAAAERAHGLIHTLADLLRPAGVSGRGALVPFLEIAQEAASEVSLALPEQSVAYHWEGAGVFLPVPRLALRQVLVQLLRNAVQAAARAEQPLVHVGAREEAAGRSFWVADRGRGVAPELRAPLDDFLAGRSATLGLGFGLLFVRLVVENWGGRLHLTSAPGQGCTATVTLPGR